MIKKEVRKKKEKIKIEKLILIFFLAVAIFVFGCKKEQPKQEAQGLSMSFVENAPPASISVGSSFPIIVDVKNTGSYKILPNKAEFFLLGIGTNLKDYSQKLSNGEPLLPDGQIRLIFANNAVSELQLQNPFRLTMLVESCYDYATTTQATICIAKQSSTVCSLEGNKIDATSNSKAPIKITSLTERVFGNELILEFVIQNVGDGKVYMPNTNCNALMQNTPIELTKQNFVKISINDGGQGFKCQLLTEGLTSIESLNGFARLGTVVCKKKLTDENMQGLIQISMEYKYRSSLSKDLTIYP